MIGEIKLSPDYWTNIQVTHEDIEYLHTTLFEREAPLTIQELTFALIEHRTKLEIKAADEKKQSLGKIYQPKDSYSIGQQLVFPTFNWVAGKVIDERNGSNPGINPFGVITVSMDDGSIRLFASRLANHRLNDVSLFDSDSKNDSTEAVYKVHSQDIIKTLSASLESDESLVQIAGRWFPRSLLVDVNVGHLNLAEAVLDMSGGEPQPTSNLLKDVSLPEGINPKLAEFSLNLALQEDDRFDEVGPAGEVLWCLRRLEPEYVREVPVWLRYIPIEHDRSILNDPMRNLEAQMDDELSVRDFTLGAEPINQITISLIYPHLRAGTLPVSELAKKLFPTAYESPRVRFTMVDGRTKQKIPGWVVRKHGYVYGLREWYKAHQLIPGSLVDIKRSDRPGEVIIEARTQRAAKDWVRTLIIGADGGMVFAMLKQPITAEFNDRMAIFVPDFKLLDPFWEKKRPFEDLVISVMRELTKLNSQGHVHAQELYAAINLMRRVPPAPLFAFLEEQQAFNHVGDLHYQLEEAKA